jgi:hypothetical protein
MSIRGLVVIAIAFTSLAPTVARAISLDDIEARTASRTVQIVPVLNKGGETGSGFLIGASGGKILIATAYHVVAASAAKEPKSVFELRWNLRPDRCAEQATPISMYHLVGTDGGRGPDVALIVADAGCEFDVRQVPSAWAEGTPSAGSRFFAIVPTGDPVQFYFGDDCLKTNSCVHMEALKLAVGGEVNEPGMSGSPVVSKAGLVGLVGGSNTVVAEPALGLALSICGEKGDRKSISGFDSAKLTCVSSPTGALVPAVFADTKVSLGCDPKIGQKLRDSSEIGTAYLCRLDLLEKNWKARQAGLDCRQWELCRDAWFDSVSKSAFVLGFDPPNEWNLLLELLDLHGYPADLVLSNPDRIGDLRKIFREHGFE